MIVLDTNVLSALMGPAPPAQVTAWLDGLPAESIWTTTITTFEIEAGVEALPEGRRSRLLKEAFRHLITEELENRVLPFDEAAAAEAARLAAQRQLKGRPADIRDTFIAGITLARRATLATRNVRHFADLAVPVINPWE